MAIELEILKSNHYFAQVSPAEIEAISRHVFEKTAAREDILMLEGEPAEALYFVASGAVKLFKTSTEGKEQILEIVRPGESFSEVPVLDGSPNHASAQAMGPVILYGIRKNALEEILREYPQVARNVIRVLASRVRHLASLVEDLSFRTVNGRIAKILLKYAARGTISGQRLTQREMAAMAGTAREVVGRSLRYLEDRGAISIVRHRIIITDREIMREISGATYETEVTDNQ